MSTPRKPPSRTHARTAARLERARQLTGQGWAVPDACAETGLDPQTWYRHNSPATYDVAEQVLAVLVEIRRAVA